MMFRRVRLLAAVAGLAAFAAASEGQAGGGTPITVCGQTVTTNAYLTGDLYCPGSDGVNVGASGITIDLKGFTLRGDRSPQTLGIDNSSGRDHVTIKNGVVRDFQNGVFGSAANTLRVSGLVASGNLQVGIVLFGPSATIQSSTASGNGVGGIIVAGGDATIRSSDASGNGGNGISVTSDEATIRSSTASGNGGRGIIADGDGATVQSSTATGNAIIGIRVRGDAARFKHNRAEANGFAGGASA